MHIIMQWAKEYDKSQLSKGPWKRYQSNNERALQDT